MKRKRKPKSDHQKLLDKLWETVSKVVRIEECRGNMGNCVTCGRPLHWKEGQAGHFIEAGSCSELRYERKNLHLQCYRCNMCLHGSYKEYTLWMIQNYGKKYTESLIDIKKAQKPYKYTDSDLEELFKKWNKRLRILCLEYHISL